MDSSTQLAEGLDDVVHYIFNSVNDSISSSSRSAVESEFEDPVVNTNRLRRLADKIKLADPSDSPSILKHVVVGFEFDEDIRKMMDRITDYSSYLQILPIVGMGGIGKSTLARQIYSDPLINQHFDIRGWVTISQDFSIPSIVSQLLASVKGRVDRVGRDSLIEI